MALPTALESEALLGHALREGWWFRAKEDIVRDFLRPHLWPGATVVVLAAGSGGTIRRLRQAGAGCLIVGLDLDPAAVAQCQALDPAGRYRVADLEHDGLADAGSADVVIALDILEHLEDDETAVARVARCLKTGGLFVVNVPAHPWLSSRHDAHLGHRRRYRPAEIEALILRHGFRIVHSTPLFLSTLMMAGFWRLLVQRLLRIRETQSDVAIRLPRLLDSLLYGLARLEGWVARLGLPFGSSHFLLARKT